MLLFLLAAGLSLIFGLTRIVNLAHGSFYLLGGYIGLSLIQQTESFLAAVVLAPLFIGVAGLLIQWFLLNRFYKDDLAQVLLTFGFFFIFSDLALWLWGGNPQALPKPASLTGSLRIEDITLPIYRSFVVGVGLLIGVLLWLFQEKSRMGAIIRAGVDNEERLRGLGVNTPLLFTGVFALGAFLAALGGVIGGPFIGVYPGADLEILLLAFVVVILGGMGSLKGAFIGSLVVGLIDSFSKALLPELAPFTIFAPMAIILVVRPSGLFGRG